MHQHWKCSVLWFLPHIGALATSNLEQCIDSAYNPEAGLCCNPYFRSILSVQSVCIPLYGVPTNGQFDVVVHQCHGLRCSQNVSLDLLYNSANNIRWLHLELSPMHLSHPKEDSGCWHWNLLCSISSKGATAQKKDQISLLGLIPVRMQLV